MKVRIFCYSFKGEKLLGRVLQGCIEGNSELVLKGVVFIWKVGGVSQVFRDFYGLVNLNNLVGFQGIGIVFDCLVFGFREIRVSVGVQWFRVRV